ncbi:hypothetical protein WMY93_020997 [Mugilogobius chulae]|uniref:Spindlin n=1 Tax=Mugilogobius chulae TaxID=88201 RepID=A0AAW0N9D8_9GOBI
MQSAVGSGDAADAGHAGVSVNMMKKKNPHKKHKGSVGGAKAGTVLDQVPVNPSLYLIKYDGFDCVYGLELHKDERVQGLEVLPDKLAKSRLTDVSLADTMIGKAVEHMFETEEGPKEEWRGMVLARAPIMTSWFYITYEKDPVLYMYQLLDDYKEGDLRIMPDNNEGGPAEREPGEVVDSLVGNRWSTPKRTEANAQAWSYIRWKPSPPSTSSSSTTISSSMSMTWSKHPNGESGRNTLE